MNQQAGPSLQKPTVDIRARPRQPPIVSKRLPLKAQVTLYFRLHTSDTYLVQLLVYLKTGRQSRGSQGYYSCDEAEQDRIIDEAKSESHKNSWDYTADNIGRYIASGMMLPTDIKLAMEFIEEASGLNKLGKPITQDDLARLRELKGYIAASDRVLENRVAFPREAEMELQLRKSQQRLNAPPPLTPEEIAAHCHAAAMAAMIITEKKK